MYISIAFLIDLQRSSYYCFIFLNKRIYNVRHFSREEKSNPKTVIFLCLIRIFFDDNVDRYLPIAIAQSSIFWLYFCYLYYFLQCNRSLFFFQSYFYVFIDVHVISFSFFGLLICTYFSWTNYYLAQKRDPGVIVSNRDQQYRV